MTIGKGMAALGMSAVAISALFLGYLKVAIFAIILVWATVILD